MKPRFSRAWHRLSVALLCLAPIQDYAQAQTASFNGLGYLNTQYGSIPSAMSADGSTVVGNGGASSDNPWIWTRTGGIRPLIGRGGSGLNVSAFGISGDGRTVVGAAHGDPVRWRDEGKPENLPQLAGHYYGWATGVSTDGSAIAGTTAVKSAAHPRAWRWTADSGIAELGNLGKDFTRVLGMSADGNAVVGWGATDQDQRAFLWTPETGMQNLGTYTGDSWSHANAVSADGRTVVGTDTSSGWKGFVWTAEAGMSLITAPTAFVSTDAFSVSADGRVVVGSFWNSGGGPSTAMYWTATGGVRSIAELLASNGIDTTGWTLFLALDVSDDGLTITGQGRNPQGITEAWIATIPSPGAICIAHCLGSAFLMRRRTR